MRDEGRGMRRGRSRLKDERGTWKDDLTVFFKVIPHPSSLILRMAAGIAALLLCGAAMSQPYPARPVRLVVPAAPGGAIDIVGRILANRLTEVMGPNIIIGTEVVARSPADGYTLLTTAGAHTINPAVYKKLPYDALRDFTPISHMANSGGLVIVVHPSVPVKSLQELIAMGRKNPGKLDYASGGFGNLTHLAGEMFQVMTGVRLTHVPYKAVGPAVNDVLAGQLPLMFGPSPVAVPMVQAGRLRPLAFTGVKRSAQLPDLP